MTINNIKAELKARGMTQENLANLLHMNASSVRRVLSGHAPLTATLASHIALLLDRGSEGIFVYKFDYPAKKVQELYSGGSALRENRIAAIEAIVHHNLQELIEIGKQCSWNSEERAYLGLDCAQGSTRGATASISS